LGAKSLEATTLYNDSNTISLPYKAGPMKSREGQVFPPPHFYSFHLTSMGQLQVSSKCKVKRPRVGAFPK